jgi:hypothetical protein
MSEIMWYKTYSPEYFATEDGTIRTFDRCVHNHYGRYRGSIQRSGKKTIYTKIYDTPNEAYEEVQFILKIKH